MNLGIWVDDPVKDIQTAKFWDNVKAHGLTTAALMLESSSDGFDSKYDERTLELVKGRALIRDIEIVLTVWPEPNRKYLQEFESKIGRLLSASGAAGLEFDCEGNWLKSKVSGFSSLDEAGDELVAVFSRVSNKHEVRTELTTYPYHAENSRAADVAPHCNRILPQAYSVRGRSEGEVPWDDRLGPGNMQRLTLDRALQVPGVGDYGGPLVSCALAAYDQEWPGHTGEEAMSVAYDAAMKYNPMEIRFWSSKWVFGVKANGYASRFIKGIR